MKLRRETGGSAHLRSTLFSGFILFFDGQDDFLYMN